MHKSSEEIETISDCESFVSQQSILLTDDHSNSFDVGSQHGQTETEIIDENDTDDYWPQKLSPTLQAIEWQRLVVEKECTELKRLQRLHDEFLEKERLEKEHTKFEQMLWDDCTLAMQEEEEHLKKLREDRVKKQNLLVNTK